jgi:hypothetical protein
LSNVEIVPQRILLAWWTGDYFAVCVKKAMTVAE